MNRRTFRKCALWLLPILALRAFLPVGFMLSMDARGLHLAFCPTQAPALAAAFAFEAPDLGAHPGADHQHHHSSAEASATEHRVAPDAPCPYALGALAIDAHAPRFAADLTRPLDELIPFHDRPVAIAGPARVAPIRGPPILS